MPTSQQILASLATVSTELAWLAIVWHVVIVALVLALVAGYRPSLRHAALMLAAPVTSVAIVSLVHGNWFNGISFILLASALAWVRPPNGPRITAGPAWLFPVGLGLVIFGLCYPEFVVGPSIRALYAAPVGLVPCPTLALVAGFTLIAGGLATRKIPVLLAIWTAFYAIFGMFRLGVMLDVGLVVAALGLVALTARSTVAPASTPHDLRWRRNLPVRP
jgi:hypothetical protein